MTSLLFLENEKNISQHLSSAALEFGAYPYPATIFSPVNAVCFFTSASYIQVLFRLDFFIEANNMNPGQTAHWEQSDLVPYRL